MRCTEHGQAVAPHTGIPMRREMLEARTGRTAEEDGRRIQRIVFVPVYVYDQLDHSKR